MIGKIKSMLTAFARDTLNFHPVKGMMIRFEGAGASNPTINTQYNVLTLTREGIGDYKLTPERGTAYGKPLGDVSVLTTGFTIAASIVSEAHFLTVVPDGADAFDILVTEMTVGVGNKLEVNPYDILSGDFVSINIFLNVGTGQLLPE